MMSRFEHGLLWISTGLMGATGAVYCVMKYLMTTDDPYAVVHHPWQPFFLKAHVVAAPLLVFAVGAIFSTHIWKQWRSDGGSGKRSGGAVVLWAAPMVLSGYLIQTVTTEPFLRGIAIAHIALGAAFVAAIAAHQLSAKARQRRRKSAESSANSS